MVKNSPAPARYGQVIPRSARSSSPAFPFPPSGRRMEYSQVVRHRFLVPTCKGSNPFTPDLCVQL